MSNVYILVATSTEYREIVEVCASNELAEQYKEDLAWRYKDAELVSETHEVMNNEKTNY